VARGFVNQNDPSTPGMMLLGLFVSPAEHDWRPRVAYLPTRSWASVRHRHGVPKSAMHRLEELMVVTIQSAQPRKTA